MTTQNGEPAVPDDHDATSLLRRRYRALLRAYPKSYRDQRGEEIIGTLLDTAEPGRSRPSLADAADLIAAGVRQRVGLDAVPAMHRGLTIAGPVALAFAAGLALVYWVVAEPSVPWRAARLTSLPPPEVYDLAPYCYAAWLVVLAVRLLLPRFTHRLLIGAALLALVAAGVGAAVSPALRAPAWPAGLVLAALGIVALAGCGQPAYPAERLRLGVVAAGTAGLAALPHLLDRVAWPSPWTWTADGTALAGVVLLLTLGGYGLRRAMAGRDGSWLWATGILSVDVGWFSVLSLEAPDNTAYVPLVVLSSLAVVSAAAWLAVRRRAGDDDGTGSGVSVAGATALGFAAALGATLIAMDAVPFPSLAPPDRRRLGDFSTVTVVAYGAWLVAAIASLVTATRWLRLTLLGAALAGTVAIPFLGTWATDPTVVTVLVPLGAVAFLAFRAPVRLTRRLVPAGFAIAGLGIVAQVGLASQGPDQLYIMAHAIDHDRSAVTVVLAESVLAETASGALTWYGVPFSVAVAGVPALVFAAVVAGYWLVKRVDDRLRRHYTAGTA